MPTFKITVPDGSTVSVDAPEGSTEQQAIEFVASTWKPGEQEKATRPSDIAKSALPIGKTNISDSLGGFIKGASRIGDTLMTPIDAMASKFGISNSILGRDDRDAAVDQVMAENSNPDSLAYKYSDIAAQIAGSAGAGGLLGKGVQAISSSPRALQIAEALRTSGMAAKGAGLPTRVAGGVVSGGAQAGLVDPQNADVGAVMGGVLPSAKVAIPMVGRGIANLVGGMGTHTGGEGLKQGALAGMAGGAKAAQFADNMRGKVPMQDVLDTAKANLDVMGKAKSAEYRAGMAQISGDKSILNFNGIDKAVNHAANTVTFKGQVKNVKAAEIQQEISGEIAKWKKLNPTAFHTPEGLDALKQRIGGIVESIPYEEKTARMVGNNIYHSIKMEITKQAPTYSKVMRNYSEATDQIKEIERALSLGGKSSVDTAMRKLQSLMRNNVNTNYGNRLDLANQLEQQGGGDIMTALAGQSLNSWTPRSLGGVVAGGLGMGGYALGGASAAVPILAAQSPRLMGEAALATGRLSSLVANPETQQALAKTAPLLSSLMVRENNRKSPAR